MAKMMTTTKRTLRAFGIVILIGAAGFMIMFLGSLGNRITPYNLIRVACVGDSITELSGYPEHLQTTLGTNYKVCNFGVSGSTVLLDSNLPYMNQSAFQRAKAFRPSIVVIMLGTNDAQENTYNSIENFQADYKKLISEYQELESNPQIWLVKPPPILENGFGLNNTNLEQGVIPQIEQVANEMGLFLIDVNTALTDYPEYFGDGVHPSSEGAILIANEISQAIYFSVAPTAPS
jgi:lysophospholipase L1-like esterase